MDKEEWKGRDAGSLGAVAYPTGSVLSYTPDGVSRPVSAVDTAHGITYANNAAYWAHGALNTLTLGSGITRTDSYSNRLQPTTLVVAASGGQRMNLSYNFNTGGGNNGNVMQIANVLNSDRTQNFTYDALNRIYQAKTQATTGQYCWGQNFTIDNWGNLYSITEPSTHAPCTVPQLNLSATATNRLNALGYDAAGNTTSDGVGGAYAYDGENRQTSVTPGSVTYTYDGDGKRVKKSNGTLYWYGTGSDASLETDLSGNMLNEYIFFAGKRSARRNASGSVYYYFSDDLGSSRIITDASGATCYDADFYPYGGERNYVNTCPQNYKFTGKERDSETGNDNFGARYFGSNLGRFMSPDPPLLDQHIADPQSWNLYSYVRNNPLSFIDPTGNSVELLCSGSDPTKCAAERQKGLEFLQKSLGNDKAASNLYINEVKDGDKTRYFVGIKGDVGDFMKQSDTSHDLANLVQNKNVVEFGLTSKDLSNQGGAVTYEKGEVGNQNVRVLVNPAQADVATGVLNPNTILGAGRFGGQNQDPRSRVNPFTGEVMAWHEFGHAWGSINGRSLDRTNPEALAWENRMRKQLYGPIGPNNAPRVAH